MAFRIGQTPERSRSFRRNKLSSRTVRIYGLSAFGYHEATAAGTKCPSEIVTTEYVRTEKTDLPESFVSKLAKQHNDAEAVETYMTVEVSPAE